MPGHGTLIFAQATTKSYVQTKGCLRELGIRAPEVWTGPKLSVHVNKLIFTRYTPVPLGEYSQKQDFLRST